jgi:hypothetical protein
MKIKSTSSKVLQEQLLNNLSKVYGYTRKVKAQSTRIVNELIRRLNYSRDNNIISEEEYVITEEYLSMLKSNI